jgi:hypothetical protein
MLAATGREVGYPNALVFYAVPSRSCRARNAPTMTQPSSSNDTAAEKPTTIHAIASAQGEFVAATMGTSAPATRES